MEIIINNDSDAVGEMIVTHHRLHAKPMRFSSCQDQAAARTGPYGGTEAAMSRLHAPKPLPWMNISACPTATPNYTGP